MGQDLSNLRSKKIVLVQDSIQLDSLSIVPSSFRISANGAILDTTAFKLNELTGVLYRTGSTPLDTLTITYRVFPLSFTRDYYNKSPDLIDKGRYP